MMYDIEQERRDTNYKDVLGGWVLYVMVVVSLAGYHLVQVFW